MIAHGTILIAEDAARPRCFQVEAGTYPHAWKSVKPTLTFPEFEKELASTGWTFFYMAGAIRTTAFGFDRARMIQAAVQRLIAQVKLQRCNCLEIDDVATRSFLGIPYVSISAHPRHIQKGMVFAGCGNNPLSLETLALETLAVPAIAPAAAGEAVIH